MNEALFEKFVNLGCSDRKNIIAAVQVYLELCEVKKYWDVEYFFHKGLDVVYFTARKSKSKPTSTFVPIPASNSLSFMQMKQYLALNSDSEPKTVYVVMVTADSTCVYYQITDGIGAPPAVVPKKLKLDKREQLDKQLKTHRAFLEESAMCGIPFTLPPVLITSNSHKSASTS